MIDLLINRRTRLPIAAKPAGSAWGYCELDGPDLVVVQMDDPPRELALAVGRRGVVANPFAEYETDPVTHMPILLRQSTVKLRSVPMHRDGATASVSIANCQLEIEN